MLRLGGGTGESHRRVQCAVEEPWRYTPELFEMDALERDLAEAGIAVDCGAIRAPWERQVRAVLAEAGITVPEGSWEVKGGRRGLHTESLGHLLSDLQFLQRAYPGLEW